MDTTQFTLESVQQQFTDWRASRSSKREQIPQRLWQAAVRLCQVHSINHVSRSLRLSYTALKKRLPGVQSTKEKSVQFLQVEVGNPCSVQWQVECIRAVHELQLWLWNGDPSHVRVAPPGGRSMPAA
jgi:hypothetical protein